MLQYQYSKLVMEKFLRRSFYDAVLELYEIVQGNPIISVSLEGNLTLVVNKEESFTIKLHEIAQRADDREDHQQQPHKTTNENGPENSGGRYLVKKEEFLTTTNSLGNEAGPSKNVVKQIADVAAEGSKVDYGEQKYKCSEAIEEKLRLMKGHNYLFEKSSEEESEANDELDSELQATFQPNTMLAGEQTVSGKMDMEPSSGEDICFLPVSQLEDLKRKLMYRDLDQVDFSEKRSGRKKSKLSSGEAGEDIHKEEDRTRTGVDMGDSSGDDTGPQLLPHTATGPTIAEEEDNSFSDSISESQLAQLPLFPLRESSLNMFRPQDLEELVRQQEQWQMVAYQCSIMEKSYLQQQMQQYQLDTERLRWEYAAQQQKELAQSRNLPPHTDETEKMYRPTQNLVSTSETAALATVLEQVKKSGKEGSDEGSGIIPEKLTAQYMRFLSEEHVASQLSGEFEEGEVRTESHTCVLCGVKYPVVEQLFRHMEKHRFDFERSCSVCQSGTLTGNMLILHMEASHGPEINFPLPSSSASSTSSSSSSSLTLPNVSAASLVASVITDFQQSLAGSLQAGFSNEVPDDSGDTKFSQQVLSLKYTASKSNELDQVGSVSTTKSDSTDHFDYALAAATAAAVAAASSAKKEDISDLPQDNFLGITAHIPPLNSCQVCGEKFALSEALDQHVESQHKDASCTYSCRACNLSFDKHVSYSQHMVRHDSSSANLKCSHCLKSFKSIKQLRLHYVAAHDSCFFCEYCRAGFPNAVSLQLHEELHTLEPDKLAFRCDICSKAFYTQSQCSAHKRTHKDEKSHACEVCGSSFFKRGDLTKHVRTVHSPSRLFSCKFCGKKGTRMDNMRSHVRSHHKNMSRDQIINMIEIIE